jgi:hypothetical protein
MLRWRRRLDDASPAMTGTSGSAAIQLQERQHAREFFLTSLG